MKTKTSREHIMFSHAAFDLSAFDAVAHETALESLRELTPSFRAWTRIISSAYLGCWARARWEEAMEFAESNNTRCCADKLIELAFGLRLDDTLARESENIESIARAISD